jgi:hypothetical protein
MILALAFVATAAAPSAADASKLTLSAPAAIVEFDPRKLKGDLFRLAWSPDAQQIYLQTIERDGAGNIKVAHHYLLGLDGKPPKGADQEPAWSTAYWTWKSTQAAPGLPAFKIEVEEQQKRVTSTSTPMGGDLAKGGTGASGSPSSSPVGLGTGDMMAAAAQTQTAHYYTLKLKGEVVGEFVNAPAIPGLTFGWGPQGTGLIAFANRDGRVVIMDDQGRKQEISSSRSALLPAWTDDGKRLGYLEKSSKDKAALKIVDVAKPSQ